MGFKDYIKEEENNSKELEMGIELEKEHNDLLDLFKNYLKEKDVEMPMSDEEFYSMIAKAHLNELPDYYTRLDKMETEAKGE